MKYYLELTLLPNGEVTLDFLWSKIYQQIHLGLVEMQNDQGRVPIGVSFPNYRMGEHYGVLCRKLRLFAQDEAILVRFNVSKWLARLSDYVDLSEITPVPEKLTGYAIYQREQPKTNKERLARRYARRHKTDYDAALQAYAHVQHKIDYDAALQHYGEMAYKDIASPFIRLQSLSGGQTFCLWIKKTVVTEAVGNTFSTYGLSSQGSDKSCREGSKRLWSEASIPEF